MKQFCVYTEEVLRQKFGLNVLVFMSKRRRHFLHLTFEKSFLSIENHADILKFIHKEWTKRKISFSDYEMNYPRIISFTKWKYDYMTFGKRISQIDN